MELAEFIALWQDGGDAIRLQTSGSTGKPKTLWAKKERMRASARITLDFLGLKAGDTALLCLPLDYIAGQMMVVRAIEGSLQLTQVTPSNHPLAPSALPQNAPCSFDLIAMVPSQVYCTLEVPEEAQRLRNTRHLIIGGGAVDDALAERLRDFPHAVWSTYGMTETLSHIALRRLGGPEASEWYTPLDHVQVSLDDSQCLIIDAPHVAEQRLVTNDIAQLHPDGQHFRILGRRDNVICSGGIKLQIEEIEARLRQVMPCPFLITKRQDAKLGEAVTLLLTDGYQDITPDSPLFDVLTPYQRPRYIVYSKEIPLTRTGKPDRMAASQIASSADISSSSADIAE